MSDLISRSALIKRLQEWNTNDVMDKALYNFAMNRINEAPKVEAREVVRGEWIHHKDYFFTPNECSNCNNLVEFKSKFCPECGTDMRGRMND